MKVVLEVEAACGDVVCVGPDGVEYGWIRLFSAPPSVPTGWVAVPGEDREFYVPVTS